MGLRTSAAKLGFRLAVATSNKKIGSSSGALSLFTRRTTTSLAATEAIEEKEKSLCLFFYESKYFKNWRLDYDYKLVIRPIDLYSYDCDEEELLEEDVDHVFRPRNLDDGSCIQIGSQILFNSKSSKNICWFDFSSSYPLKIHVSSPTETKIKSFRTEKPRMSWGVIDGKFYCIYNCFRNGYKSLPMGTPFEFLDPEINDANWQPLKRPPFLFEDGDNYTLRYSALFLNGSKKILGWEYEKRGVFCFDTTKPENGWILSPPRLGDSVPFITRNSTFLAIDEHHPTIGKYNLVFAYDCKDDPFVVYPIFISDSCDSFQNIDQLIRLPKQLCSKYRVAYCDVGHKSKVPFDSQLVYLGANRFCVILHKFFKEDRNDENRTKGLILVLTYEYNITVNDEITEESKPNLKIKTRLLGTRQFKYCPKKKSVTTSVLVGAFAV